MTRMRNSETHSATVCSRHIPWLLHSRRDTSLHTMKCAGAGKNVDVDAETLGTDSTETLGADRACRAVNASRQRQPSTLEDSNLSELLCLVVPEPERIREVPDVLTLDRMLPLSPGGSGFAVSDGRLEMTRHWIRG